MDYWALLLSVFGAGGLAGALGQILVARYSKSHKEKDVGLAKEYLSLANITADELEKRINLIAKLDDDIRKLNNENYLLAKGRADEDERIESLEAHVAALQAQIDTDARERGDLRQKLVDLDVRYRVLWKYLIALLEQFRQRGIKPVEPPEELKNDPEIARLLNGMNKEAK